MQLYNYQQTTTNKLFMKLKNLKTHPKHSNFMTHTGFPLYRYQKTALDTVVDNYKKFLKNGQKDVIRNTVDGPVTGYKLRMLPLGTGDGKSFLAPYILKLISEAYLNDTGKHCITSLASPLLEVLGEHKKELLLEFLKSPEGKDFELIVDKVDSILNVTTIDEYLEGNLNLKNKHLIVCFSHQYLSNNKEKIKKLGINAIVIDEAKGINFGNDDEAKMEGEKDPLLSWWKSIQSLTAYIVVLNATPSEAHQVNYYNNYEVLDFDDESKDWKHPWLETPVKLVSVQSKAQKKKIIEDNVMEFVVHQMEHNQLLDYLEEVCPMMNDLWSKLRLQTAMIKLDRESKDSKGKVKKNTKALSVNEAKHLLEDLNEELKGTKIKIYDYVQEKYIEKEYDTDLICPVIKDQKNNTSLDRINNAKYKDNILLVCELGTYGINIPSLSMLIGVRDTYRHLGKEYTITQLLGRLARNVLVDNYFLCDKIVSANPDMKHFPLIKRALMNVTKKSAILFSSVTINDNALEAFADKLPNEQGMSDKIDKILLDDFGWIPQDKNMMNSSGSDIERSYEDRRTDKCSVCDNAMFDLHENKLIDDGHSLVEARFLSIKQFMHNGHTHTRDDETQRSICYSCHMIETMDHKHYLSSDHPDRTTAK